MCWALKLSRGANSEAPLALRQLTGRQGETHGNHVFTLTNSSLRGCNLSQTSSQGGLPVGSDLGCELKEVREFIRCGQRMEKGPNHRPPAESACPSPSGAGEGPSVSRCLDFHVPRWGWCLAATSVAVPHGPPSSGTSFLQPQPGFSAQASPAKVSVCTFPLPYRNLKIP